MLRVLPGGTRLVVKSHPVAPVVSTQVWVSAGSADERPDQAGLAHLHEHMLFKGTTSRPVGGLASEIEAAGGDINAWTSFDQTVYHTTLPSREVETGIDILSDAIQRSLFDPLELSREIEVVVEEIRRAQDNPAQIVGQGLYSTLFSVHPYGRPVIGSETSVRGFTREKVLEFYRSFYRPENLTVVVAGDVEEEWVHERMKEAFHSRPEASSAGPRPTRPLEPPLSGPRLQVFRRPVQETHIQLGWHGPDLKDADSPALDVLSIMLGGGESSRLYRHLKRERELVSDVFAFAHTPRDPGLFVVGAMLHGDHSLEAIRALLDSIFSFVDAPAISAHEVEKAKAILNAERVYQSETTDGFARKLGFFSTSAGSLGFEATYYEALQRVQPEDVSRVARRFLDPSRFAASLLLPADHATELTEAEWLRELQGRGPVAAKPKAVQVEWPTPRCLRAQIRNGCTVVVQEDRSVPRVSIRAAAVGGLLAETPDDNGVGQLTGRLLVRGTRRRTAEAITDALDEMAAGITGASGRNSLGLSGDFLTAAWPRGMELFLECLLEPSFDAEELERERRSQIEDVWSRRDSASSIAFERFQSELYGAHPYGLPVTGTESTLRSLTRSDIESAFRTQLHPARLKIAVVGDVDAPSTLKSLESWMMRASSEPAPDGIRSLALVERPRWSDVGRTWSVGPSRVVVPREQAHCVLGFPAFDFSDSRRFSAEVLAAILGGQAGRLFIDLRDRQSLAYSVSSFHLEGLHPGCFGVYVATSPEKESLAWSGVESHLRSVVSDGVLEEEVERARRYLLGIHEIGLQRASSRASSMALMEAYGLGFDAYLRVADQLAAVTPASVHEVARTMLEFAPVRVVAGPSTDGPSTGRKE
ncbi:MAG: M16 family metallopeptidase [Myxococcota bacterium]